MDTRAGLMFQKRIMRPPGRRQGANQHAVESAHESNRATGAVRNDVDSLRHRNVGRGPGFVVGFAGVGRAPVGFVVGVVEEAGEGVVTT